MLRGMPDTLTIGVIAPHGDEAVPDACDDSTPGPVATQRAMDEMARRIASHHPDAIVLATPHNVHVTGHMAVLTASRLTGRLDEAARPVDMTCSVDQELAIATREEMVAAGVPTVGVSFGGNVSAEAIAPMDWGTLVPLWHIARHIPNPKPVVIAPARDLDAEAHIRAGAAAIRAARRLGRRVAFVASADQGHGHTVEGPYGFHPESAEFDLKVCEIVRGGKLQQLAELTSQDAQAAHVDSWWQMLMLHGALEEDQPRYRADLLSYEVWTYFGMLTAVFERA
jgi:aromatic ring-opening dioxygenase LigB subunit